MATSPTSYLQTLAKNEAIAFVASLQKVKEHLNHELQWINAQAEQKTTQLQGIEAILGEAVTLGLISTSSIDNTTSNLRFSSPPVVDLPEASNSNGSASLAESIDTADLERDAVDEPITADVPLTSAHLATALESDRRKANDSNPKSATQTSAGHKSRASKARSTSAAKKSTGKASQSAKSPDLKHFVRAEFQEQSFTDAVAQILEESREPIGLSDVIAKLYGDLSNQDYQRAKISLTNVLSTGKNKGKWNSIGRGMYASKAVAASL